MRIGHKTLELLAAAGDMAAIKIYSMLVLPDKVFSYGGDLVAYWSAEHQWVWF